MRGFWSICMMNIIENHLKKSMINDIL